MQASTMRLPLPFGTILGIVLLSLLSLYYVLQAKVLRESGITLTPAQISEIETAYKDGFHFNSNNQDPCEKLRLQIHKKLGLWKRQFRKRGFTIQKIKDMLQSGRRQSFSHPKTPDIVRTKIFDEAGNWIVVDFVDCVVWQIAPANFK